MDLGFSTVTADVASIAPTAGSWALTWVTFAACGLALVPAMSRVWWGLCASGPVPGGGDRAATVGGWRRDGAAVSKPSALSWRRQRSRHVSGSNRPSGTRLLMKTTGALHRSLYRRSGGRVGRKLRGHPVLLLTTTGRKTGHERTWPLCYVRNGDSLVLVASAGGAPRHPAWYLNLRANPCVSIRQGDGTRTMVARTAGGIERGQLWERLVRQFPMASMYQHKTSRVFPVVVLEPAP